MHHGEPCCTCGEAVLHLRPKAALHQAPKARCTKRPKGALHALPSYRDGASVGKL